jgi:hypothetical protein
MEKQPILASFFRGRGGSGEIRGTQMAEYLGAKLNPIDNYENDVCIYVKIQPPRDYPECSYLDIIDGIERMGWIKRHPDIRIIASSMSGLSYLSKSIKNDLFYIPQHHCNFERFKRENREIHTVGVVGGNGAIMNDEIKRKLDILHVKPRNRMEAVEAYKKLDIQIIWRLSSNPLKNPLKIVNAASFGVPTIAYPSKVYQEMEGYYYPVWTIDEMIKKIKELKQGFDAQRLIDKAEEFHIEHIVELYRRYLWN